MGHHIDYKGRFQSDKYPDLPPDKIILSFHDPVAQSTLRYFALFAQDRELARDISQRLDTLGVVGKRPGDGVPYFTITSDDVGRTAFKQFGKVWPIADSLGLVLPHDIGKRVYLIGDILQIENDEQRNQRLEVGQ